MDRMRLRLWKQRAAVQVECLLTFCEPPAGFFSFELARGYQVEKIVDSSGRSLEFKVAREDSRGSPYRADRKRYIVQDSLGTEFSVLYSGASRAQHTIFTDDILAVNAASGWYPGRISPGGTWWDAEVFIHLGQDYVVLNSHFVPNENAWHYRPQEDELFIIALKNCKRQTSRRGVIYYYPQTEMDDQKAAVCVHSLDKLLPYFESLYGCSTAGEVPIVLLPTDLNAGDYNIDRTIILNRFLSTETQLIHMLGHELAHNWCCGAPGNWEDWLNETSAEWSALAFLLENGQESYVHDTILGYCTEEKPEPIRTRDGQRPQQVHLKGTLLFHGLYRKHGLAVIKDFLRAFVELEDKNTESWLKYLSRRYPHIVPEIIEGLNAELLGVRL